MEAPAEAGEDERLTPDEAWSHLLEKDDRTSPEDQPDMLLITWDELADYMARAQPQAREEAQPVWVDGLPSKHHAQEWFIAETTFGERVVLTALPEEYAYDFKTADETYIKADRIKRWMPFPDSQYLFPTPPAPEAEKLRVAVEALGRARESIEGWYEAMSGEDHTEENHAVFLEDIAAIDQALAALQQEDRPDA